MPGRAFVDRTDMLALLGRELEQTERGGRARLLVVTGDPGIGKSRLARELGYSLPPQRFLVGRCEPFGQRRPLSGRHAGSAAADMPRLLRQIYGR